MPSKLLNETETTHEREEEMASDEIKKPSCRCRLCFWNEVGGWFAACALVVSLFVVILCWGFNSDMDKARTPERTVTWYKVLPLFLIPTFGLSYWGVYYRYQHEESNE